MRDHAPSRGLLSAAVVTWALWMSCPQASARELATLVYSKSERAQRCPSEAELKNEVVRRLGYDPFRDSAPRRVWVVLEQSPLGYFARIELSSGRDVLGVRELHVVGACEQLLDLIALSLSIAIDPKRAQTREPAEASEIDAESAPSADPTSQSEDGPDEPRSAESPAARPGTVSTRANRPVSSAPRPDPSQLRIALLPELNLDSLPSPAFGGWLSVGLYRAGLAVTLGARATAPVRTQLAGGGFVESRMIAAAVSGCGTRWLLEVCGVFQLGRFSAASSQVIAPARDSVFYGTVGPRLALEWPRTGRFAVRLQTEAAINLAPLTLELLERRVWSAPGIALFLGAGASVRF